MKYRITGVTSVTNYDDEGNESTTVSRVSFKILSDSGDNIGNAQFEQGQTSIYFADGIAEVSVASGKAVLDAIIGAYNAQTSTND